ncbi:hypothetical protein DL95DRAFT_417610 [Leptodontidium sp. 2 PMI_412]|nr:hypothetical protein DL95DRAFT_417610 [Leptodontidium sp. 2 PMI_412]
MYHSFTSYVHDVISGTWYRNSPSSSCAIWIGDFVNLCTRQKVLVHHCKRIDMIVVGLFATSTSSLSQPDVKTVIQTTQHASMVYCGVEVVIGAVLLVKSAVVKPEEMESGVGGRLRTRRMCLGLRRLCWRSVGGKQGSRNGYGVREARGSVLAGSRIGEWENWIAAW